MQDQLMSFRSKTLILAFAALLSLGMAGDAFARAGGGFSMGSRGYRTYSSPPLTSTSPWNAAPIQRSTTPYGNYGQGYGYGVNRPGFLSGGLGRGLLGGFLGAGLFGLLFGHGLSGGLGGGMSFLGLLLQLGLIYLLIRFAMNFFRGNQPAYSGGPSGSANVGAGPQPGSYGGFASGPPLTLEPEDYTAFERRLSDVQSAFGDEDLNRLRSLATPEMVGYFSEELAGNQRRGVVNRISGTKLLKGDLAEAWREGGAEYATVALLYSLIDTMVDRASGRIVSGNPTVPEEVTELWTFVRAAGSGPQGWMVSAIQQRA
jgi:predicted lipid-binding transport protein (Tim44 family)